MSMVFNGIVYNKLSYLEQFYKDPFDGIPEESGIYFWVYWPEYDPQMINPNDLIDKLAEFSCKSLQSPEEILGRYKFKVKVEEQRFGKKSNPFGISDKQKIKLLKYLMDPLNVNPFFDFFKEICFARPFYIGKAINLRNRLANQHFNSKTRIIPEIDAQNILHSEIWVGYKKIPSHGGDEISTLMEEILSRNIKPGLTIKPN
ncbi:GIY-YIG nuclease family protein [Lunatibacter salilacus]|uniref:hypothetical protein n=1 Tax=Lunatibacter salilacus TaxID=2483804 RepID=UPI00131B781A|nr:hypothetical protein [Lunatibacter salilacus]